MSDETNPPEITWGQALPVWWAFMWRSSVWSMAAAMAIGTIVGVIAGVLGRVDLGAKIGMVLGFFVSIPVSLYALKVVLGKQFNGFRIVVAPSQPT